MKNRRFLGIAAAAALLFVMACPNPSSPPIGRGSLTVTVTNGIRGRTLVPSISMVVESYVIRGAGPGGASFSVSTSSGSATIDALAPGSWTVTVDALNEDGTLIGQGTADIVIRSAETGTVSLSVAPLTGNGTLSLTVKWDSLDVAVPSVNAVLRTSTGEEMHLSFTSTANPAELAASTAIASGYYMLVLQLLDKTIPVAGAMEVVRIVSGQETAGAYSFTNVNRPGGDLTVNITSEMADPIPVRISGIPTYVPLGSTVNAAASVEDGTPGVVYVWFLNGEPQLQATGASWSSRPLAAGHYRLDVAVYSADGARWGSETQSWEVPLSADANPPMISVFVINAGAAMTVTAGVTITIEAADAESGLKDMRFSNDGGLAWTPWEPYAAAKSWTLSTGDGTKTVTGEVRDNQLNSRQASDSIALYTRTPVIRGFSINGGAQYTNSIDVTLTSNVSDVAEMSFTNDGGEWSAWVAYAATSSWKLDAMTGTRTVNARYRDEAGTIVSASDTIVLDTVVPVIGGFSINGGAVYTTSRSVTLDSIVTGAAQMSFANNGGAYGNWIPYAASYPWTLSGDDGTRTVNARYRDDAENMVLASDTIVLDTVAPAIAGFSINGGAMYATSPSVTLNSSVTGATQMRFSNDGANWGAWVPYAPAYAWTLPNSSGTCTVYAQYRDDAGNVSSATDAIMLDIDFPAIAGFSINGNAQYTTTLSVTLNSSVTGASQMRFNNDGGAWSSWGPYAATFSWTLLNIDGTRTVNAQYRDEAGNVVGTNDPIVLDTVAPAIAGFSINDGAEYTRSVSVTLNSNVTGATQMRFINDGSAWSSWVTYAAAYAWTLSSANGTRVVDAQYRDEAGNVAGTADKIIFDNVPPIVTLSINGGAAAVNPFTVDGSFAVSLTVSASDAVSGLDQMLFANAGGAYGPPMPYAASYANFPLLNHYGTRTVYCRVSDRAGNVREVTDSIVVNAYIQVDMVDLYITDGGDGDDPGDLYWYFRVDGATVINRPESNELEVNSRSFVGQANLPRTVYSFHKPPSSGQAFTMSGQISDNDSGLRGSDDHSNVCSQTFAYPWTDAAALIDLLTVTGSPAGFLYGVISVND